MSSDTAARGAARPKAFLFDVFGTCVDWRTGIATAVAAAGAERGATIDGCAAADAWRGRYQPSMEEVRSGRRSWTILDVLHRESLDAVLAELGAEAVFDGPARDALTRAWWRLDPWPDVAPGLMRLKAVGLIAPCSNGNVALMANLAKRAALPWDAIVGGEPARAYKPDPQAYLRSAEMLGVEPGDCMMVAAHNYDLAAARALGLMTGFVPRPTEYGPGQTTDLRPEADWDVVAVDFCDLARQVGG